LSKTRSTPQRKCLKRSPCARRRLGSAFSSSRWDGTRDSDDDLLLTSILEAHRFHTPAPIMVRLALADHVLAKGTPFETVIPAGKLIFASKGSAMMAETELNQPLEFRLDRPTHHYLHFGWGIHQCLGKYISHVQVVEMMEALLVLLGLRRG